MSSRRRAVWAPALLALAIGFAPLGAAAQAVEDASAMFAEVERLLRDVADAPVELKQAGFAEAAALIDRIVEQHPGSDEAVRILLGEPIGGFDPAEIRRLAATPPVPSIAPPTAWPAPPERAQAAPAGPVPSLAPSPDRPPAAPPADAAARRPVADASPSGPRAPSDAPATPAADVPPARPAATDASPPAGTASPPPERVASPAEQEAALRLGLPGRQDVQRRLGLIGFDPGGVDGVLGPRARGAIARWQASRGFAATGYLDAAQLAALRRQSARAYARWEAGASRVPARRPTTEPPGNPTGRYVDSRGCLREADGAVVPGFRFDCD